MDLKKDLPYVTIDPFQMERAIHNIVNNAMDAMPSGGSLRVSTALKKMDKEHFHPQLNIEITDSGHGLTAEQIHQASMDQRSRARRIAVVQLTFRGILHAPQQLARVRVEALK